MATADRRSRERAARRQAIIDAARELARTDGWDGVTVRRLADRIEYSQPVLYSHFADKTAIVREVAIGGFVALADALHTARTRARTPRSALRATIRAYLHFAETEPAVYEAMFTSSLGIPFADPETPSEPTAAFEQLCAVVAPFRPTRSVPVAAEALWSTLHGAAELARHGRLPASGAAALRTAIEELFAGHG